jgi:hypothetical protein
MGTRHPALILSTRALALIAAVLVLWHGITQGISAAQWWRPCFAQGFDSAVCSFLQYEEPSVPWQHLFALWPWEVAIAGAVAVMCIITRHAPALAVTAGVAVAVSNLLVDYVITPLFIGGYYSADTTPGFGGFGAGALIVAGALFALVGVLPRRTPRAARPVNAPARAASV